MTNCYQVQDLRHELLPARVRPVAGVRRNYSKSSSSWKKGGRRRDTFNVLWTGIIVGALSTVVLLYGVDML